MVSFVVWLGSITVPLRFDADLPLPVFEQIRVQVERRGRAGTFLWVRTPASASVTADLSDLDEAADALAVIARQLGVEETAARDSLATAFDRLR